MNVKKLKREDVGTHHPEQALILTDAGELFVTRDVASPEGFELVKFQTYDLEQLTSIVNNVLKGNSIVSAASVQLEASTIFVSTVSNLFKVKGYSIGAVLDRIIGGRESQIITVVGDGIALNVTMTGNLKLDGDMLLQSPYSILLLQKVEGTWVELSRKQNS